MACEFSVGVECTCKNVECGNHGKCCECVKRHKGLGNLPFCLRHIENIVEQTEQ